MFVDHRPFCRLENANEMKNRPFEPRICADRAVPERERAFNAFLVDSLSEHAVFAVSSTGIVMSWNAGAHKVFGYTRDEIVGRSFELMFTADDARNGEPQAELVTALGGGSTHRDRWHVRKDGSRFWSINSVGPLFGPDGALLGFTKLVRDSTVSHIAAEELKDSEQKLRLLVEGARDFALFSVGPDGTITAWSAGSEKMFGYRHSDIIGKPFDMLFCAADVRRGLPQAELSKADVEGSIDTERWLVRSDGSTFLAGGKTSKLQAGAAGDSRGFIKLVHDVTARQTAPEDRDRQAAYDALTGLPNRRTFLEYVRRAISIVKRRASRSFAVLSVDLDNFKAINDTLGHAVADEVLALVARRMEKCVRAEDVVARVGGDEFAVLLNGIDGALDADDAAQRILAQMREAVHTDSGDVFAAVSVGIALGSPKYDFPADILRDAGAAMYVAKSRGRARAVTFDESISQTKRKSVDLTASLRHAIERDELRLAYQPVFRLTNMAVVGLEALVRWKHPKLGLLPPSAFVPQAEDSNLIIAVDRWVLANACRQLRMWQSRGIAGPALQMSINISSKEFSRDDFVAELRGVLDASNLHATGIRLEITEGAMLERSKRASAALAAVRELGVSVDFDDFGTGYASLSALSNITVDGLKVDWSFVTNANQNHGWHVVESVVSLARKLGVVAIAEGIETAEQLNRLVSLGCDLGQGFYFSPGIGAVAAAALLRQRHANVERSAKFGAPLARMGNRVQLR
jgi:diguanylate cyclase (GGDEF)-like protein/PAS domain S-box-containing protein